MAERLRGLLVVVDYFNKMMHIIPLKEATGAYDVVIVYFACFLYLYSLPTTIVTDFDPYFKI